ncbi:MAG TPA: elongation factor Ts [Planctomycetes bacterium]|nr:elongation factor Ts [Planctomycetota bacterium]HIJ70037.1 elongation factor Ts [Planctomycetota bacterium]
MAEIAASVVMKLRKMSGQGMMDCKKALVETNGDITEAMALLRKKGLATLAKRAARETTEGIIVCKKDANSTTAAMAALCCETDFVAKSDDFTTAAHELGKYMLACRSDEGTDAILETDVEGKKFSEVLTEAVSKTGEKIEVGDFTRYTVPDSGVIGTYVHFNNKVGAMVQIEADTDESAGALSTIAADIAMHITAIKPVAVDSDKIDPAIIQREKEIAAEQMKNKPANIIDKIVEGKMKKFFKENCLVEQPFVKDDSKTVAQVLAEVAKQAGGEAKIKKFVRFEIG